jgi:hypothetical protein
MREQTLELAQSILVRNPDDNLAMLVVKQAELDIMNSGKLPSLWAIGDRVSVIFPGNGGIDEATVCKIAFDKHNILYDVIVPFKHYTADDRNETGFTRLHSIRQWHLRNAKHEGPAVYEEGKEVL